MFGAFAAVFLSGLGLGLCIYCLGSTLGALRAAGLGVSTLEAAGSSLLWYLAGTLLLDLVVAAVMCLSTFECDCCMSSTVMHCVTKASSLSFWSFLVWCSFLFQLAVSTFVMVGFVLIDFLVFLCNTDSGTINQAQALVYEISNFTSPAAANTFQPLGTKNVTDTPIISLLGIMHHLDIPQFCINACNVSSIDFVVACGTSATRLDDTAAFLCIGCLLVTVSQALMATALSGEKERVSVHELHEREMGILKHIGHAFGTS